MANQPNLVFVFSDRQRFDTLEAYGNDYVKAPNLNALAKESIVSVSYTHLRAHET